MFQIHFASSQIFSAHHLMASAMNPGTYQWSTAAFAAAGTASIFLDRSSMPELILLIVSLNCASLKATIAPPC
ncbi:hypothetical protein GCM10029964_101090 [Kibdelosporangium lantanae]